MKEFEKQWEKNQPVWDMGEDTIGHYNKAKKYWREALEWLYIEMTGYDSTQIRDIINEELEE